MNFAVLVLLFPLVGVLLNGFWGKRLPKPLVSWIACSSIGLSFLTLVGVLIQLLSFPADNRALEVPLFTWLQSGNLEINVAILLDPLSVVMMLVVTGVGFFIHLYSIGYMADDRDYSRYFTYLNLFTLSMLVLVMGNSFLVLYIGWEAVGLCSYLLIGFWFERKSAADAAKKAFIVNRVGDFFFLLGILLVYYTFGSVEFRQIFIPDQHAPAAIATVMALLLFAGACGKSAQIPLYVWLPDAMEGPTPVSALIHAATMVTAGVYMVARCHVLFDLSPAALNVVALIGAATALFAATIGLVQNDIKRVLAYSTISQLGYMFLACGVGAYSAAVFHLMTHAFFKACLFLGAGSVIHALGGEQDIRKMGGLRSKLPSTHWTFLFSSLAIAGIFPFAGFFSKDQILGAAYQHHRGLWFIGLFTALLTAFYMFRLVFKVFYGESRLDPKTARHLHESPKVMTIPLMVLAVLALVGGWIGLPLISEGNLLQNFLGPVLRLHEMKVESPGIEIILMIVSLIVAISGILIARYLYLLHPGLPSVWINRYPALYRLVLEKYRVDEAYHFLFVRPGYKFAGFLSGFCDSICVDGAVNGIAHLIQIASANLRRWQSSYVRNYALSILFGAVGILLFFLMTKS